LLGNSLQTGLEQEQTKQNKPPTEHINYGVYLHGIYQQDGEVCALVAGRAGRQLPVTGFRAFIRNSLHYSWLSWQPVASYQSPVSGPSFVARYIIPGFLSQQLVTGNRRPATIKPELQVE
jgi:hypothetical protein